MMSVIEVRSCRWEASLPASHLQPLFVVLGLGEDHAPGGGLQHLGDNDRQIFVDVFAAVVHDYHGAVIEVAHPLARLPAPPHYLYLQPLPPPLARLAALLDDLH